MKEAAPFLIVFDDSQTCVGFVLKRGPTGFEAFGADEESLGLFATQAEAAAAIRGQSS
jgi:hypothetical protein